VTESTTADSFIHSCYISDNKSALITVPFTTTHTSVSAILDSASTLNIVSDQFVKESRIHVLQTNPVTIKGISSTDTHTTGWVLIQGRIKSVSVTVPAYVVPHFNHKLLLGIPFITQTPVDIVSSEKCVLIKGERFPINDEYFSELCIPVRLSESVIIPPNHEVAAPVFVTSSSRSPDVVIEDCFHISNKLGIRIGTTLTCVNNDPRVRIINSTKEPITLPSGIKVAEASIALPGETLADELPAQKEPKPWNEILHEFDTNPKLTSEQRRQLFNLITEFQSVISCHTLDLGLTPIVKHKIDTGNADPIKCRPYRISFTEQQELDKLVKAFLDQKLIRESQSPWAAPVVLVKKKDGGTRFCVDWRLLNSRTKKDAMPLPIVHDTLSRLSGSKFFTTLDFRSGFYQVELEEDSKEKTAFVTSTGLYEFERMGMGLTNAPATFQRLVNQIFRPLEWKNVLTYLDDVIIFSESFEDHLQHIRSVFELLLKANLKLKPSKCSLCYDKVEYLGHIVSADGISPNPKKISVIQNWPVPENQKQLSSFLGLASYYRRFVRCFSDIAKPISNLLKNDVPWSWGRDQQEAFETLVHRLCSAPVLAFPNFKKEFLLSTDASGYGIGAILKQHDENEKERVIAYASRNLSKPETNYSVTEREMLAVVFGITQFRHFLFGNHFKVITDHCALCYLMELKNPNGRLMRWSLLLQDFDFQIVYKSGKSHRDVDALSRLPGTADQVLVISTNPRVQSSETPGQQQEQDENNENQNEEQNENESNRNPNESTCSQFQIPNHKTMIAMQRADPQLFQIISSLQSDNN
jgi:hypothetical protein